MNKKGHNLLFTTIINYHTSRSILCIVMYLEKISVVLEFGSKQAQLNNKHLGLLD